MTLQTPLPGGLGFIDKDSMRLVIVAVNIVLKWIKLADLRESVGLRMSLCLLSSQARLMTLAVSRLGGFGIAPWNTKAHTARGDKIRHRVGLHSGPRALSAKNRARIN
jgi:hypothetical protein